MLELLRFVFEDIWHFLGTLVLIVYGGDAVAGIARAMFQRKKD